MKFKGLSLVLFFIALAVPALAQNEASLSGTVQDSTGAVLSNANVKLTSRGQGSVRTAQTNQSGLYSFSFLAAGGYDLEVSATGFKTTTQTNIILGVAQSQTVNVTLEIGNVSENITVSANTESINTDTAEVGTVVDNTKVVEMPLNGRQMWSLAQLTPNVMPPTQGSSLSFRGGFNVAGNAETSNNFLLNGFDNNDPDVFAPNFRPSIDAIEEFNILTGVYSAQYGYGSGGQVIVTTKSGTNGFHGSAFEFLRNQVLDARNFFLRGPTPSFKQNQFGGTVGGPIIKDKTFFFFSYEGLRQSSNFSSLNTVPTAAELQGNFAGIPVNLKDPTTGAPYPNNQIPANLISPIGQALLAYLPAPTTATPAGLAPANNFTYSQPRIENLNQDSLKVDHVFSSKDSGYATANYFNDPSFEPSNSLCQPKNLPGFGCYVNQRSQVYGIAETHIFSASIVNQARIGVSMLVQPRTPEVVSNFWSQFGINPTPVPINLPVIGPPITTITGYVNSGAGFGNYSSQRRADLIWIYNDNVAITHGRHNIKIGGNLSHFGTNNFSSTNYNGTLTFSNTNTGPTTGYALADALEGLPSASGNTPAQQKYYGRNANIAAYIMDDFKVNNKLTLNLGLRWEMNTPPIDEANRLTSFNPTTGLAVSQSNPGVGATKPLNIAFGSHVFNFDWHDYAPRIGVAWQPTGDGKTVIRVGAGTFYNGLNINNGIGGIFKGYPYTVTNTYTSSIAQPLLLSNPYPASGAVTSLSITGIDPNYRNPRVYEWSFGVQRQISKDMTAEIAYFGSSGNHLQLNQNINQAPPGPGTPAQVNARRPYPQWGTITWYGFNGNSHYQSLQAKLNKRLAYGLSYLAAFTWGKSIDDVAGAAGANLASNQYDNMTGRGLSTFDVRYRFVISPVYELPFGKGKRWLNSGIGEKIAGGWQISSLFQAQTGTPLTAVLSGTYSNIGSSGADRPNLLSNPNDNAPRTPSEWFNTAAFQIPIANGKPGALYQFGNEGRGSIEGPGLVTVDISLVRAFSFKERIKLQVRFESFDALNHPIFSLPNLTADGSTFGTITSTIATGTPGRQNQAALKLIF